MGYNYNDYTQLKNKYEAYTLHDLQAKHELVKYELVLKHQEYENIMSNKTKDLERKEKDRFYQKFAICCFWEDIRMEYTTDQVKLTKRVIDSLIFMRNHDLELDKHLIALKSMGSGS